MPQHPKKQGKKSHCFNLRHYTALGPLYAIQSIQPCRLVHVLLPCTVKKFKNIVNKQSTSMETANTLMCVMALAVESHSAVDPMHHFNYDTCASALILLFTKLQR
jgi:hypothetical protein